jgi:hypothetical protein
MFGRAGVQRHPHRRSRRREGSSAVKVDPLASATFRLLLCVLTVGSGCGSAPEQPELRGGDVPRENEGAFATETIGESTTGRSVNAIDAVLSVEGEGFRLVLLPRGDPMRLPFGTSYEETRRTISSVLGSEPMEEGSSPECQMQFASWRGGVSTWFIEERLVGWSIRSSEAGISTANGVGVGSTRSELEASYVARLFPSSLGAEFSTGGIMGLLESFAPEARVVHLWGGQACIAR